ncbi:MAG: response regulator [Candidatus Wildermuthbacteria bacterium]|nr:response regulator [Candidatus Wildermuthbacteria bacterium]
MKPKILLVEDDPLLIDIYTTKLNEAGFDVFVAEDGEKVEKLIEKEQPEVVLLDIVLPHLDGWQVLSRLKKQGILDHCKVAVLSNLGQKEEIEKGLKLGAVKYLVKAHYTPSEIANEVASLLEK